MIHLTSRNEPREAIARAIRHVDHVTYVARPESEEDFVRAWTSLGMRAHVCVRTSRFPARHIALVGEATREQPWSIMTGLSVSDDPGSPINELVRRYGEGQQHVAYGVDPGTDIEELHEELSRRGWTFMTPVLTYRDGAGARLRQAFVAPIRPYGTFVELVQRLPGEDGSPYDGFDPMNIDDLYERYADYSAWLERTARRAA
jgi:4-hydroxyphenylpyruvate dioxygenase-like putative hemolysin